jgi:hypothetical protein
MIALNQKVCAAMFLSGLCAFAADIKILKPIGPINPMIYGTNYLAAKDLNIRSVRYGGNGTDRSNMFNGKYNNADDWDYSNVGIRDTADTVNPYRAMKLWGCEPIMQVSLLGYVSADQTWGNVKVDPLKYALQEIADLNDKQKSGITYWCMGNEPDCWRSTHSDVWKHDLGYQEYYDRFARVASGIKKKYPALKLLGPSSANEYFYFNLNRKADHDSLGDFLPWFLRQCAAYEKKNGVRILDYLDFHRYPSGNDLSPEQLATVGHEWWDTAGSKAPFLPLMKKWVATGYPGTKLSVSEYGFWGNGRPIFEALWVAQTLGAFGKYGVSNANAWYTEEPTRVVLGLYANLFGNVALEAFSPNRHLDIFASKNSKNSDVIVMAVNTSQSDTIAAGIPLAGISTVERWSLYGDSLLLKSLHEDAHVVAKNEVFTFSPFSVTCLRFATGKKADRSGYIPVLKADTFKVQFEPGDQRSRRRPPRPNFYYPTLVTYDRGGFDTLRDTGDCGARRGGAWDQIPTSTTVYQDSFALPDTSVVFFKNNNRRRNDALVFSGIHRPGGWWDAKIASELKWPDRDISPAVAHGGFLVFYVNGEKGGEDFTVYLENRGDPRKTIQLRVTDYLEDGIDRDIKTWQRVEIPLKDFDMEEQKIDPKTVRYIGFANGWNFGRFTWYLDNLYVR